MYSISIFLIFIFLAAIFSSFLLVYAVIQHKSDKSLYLIFLSLCTFLYSLGYLLEITSVNIEAAFSSVRVQYMGLTYVLPVSYLFVRDIYNKPRLGKGKIMMLFLIPVMSTLTMQSYPKLTLYYKSIAYIHNGDIAICRITPGPLYHLYVVNSYFIFALIIIITLQNLMQKGGSKYKRRQGWILFVAYTAPMFSSLPYVFSTNAM